MTSQLRRGQWTAEEDAILTSYIAVHGEGRWESLAHSAGLRRTGKSCRLRWLNYLRPDVRRGNITAEEQLLILQLHSRWGNRWCKIAEHLPGRTDNEIKNYWRTRVQKHAKALRCDPNSRQFQDIISQLWIPLLLDKIHQHNAATDLEEGKVTPSSSLTAESSFSTAMSADNYTSDGPCGDYCVGDGHSSGHVTEVLPEFDQIVWEDECDGFVDSWSCDLEELWQF